jgi:hypothetical protein
VRARVSRDVQLALADHATDLGEGDAEDAATFLAATFKSDLTCRSKVTIRPVGSDSASSGVADAPPC